MPKALAITGAGHTAPERREAATRSSDADATRRMLALALVLEGYKRGEAGKRRGMDRQSLRDWVLRYTAEAIAGLCNRRAAGPKPRLTPEQEATVAELVRKRPDLAKHGVVRWRRVDLHSSPAGPYLLPAMPSAKSTGRKHGGICAGDGHHRQPSRRLSRLRLAYSPAGEPSENQGDSGES